MSKALLFILNMEIPAGKAINSLAHLSLGLGHRIPVGKMPQIEILFANSAHLHTFREAAYELHTSHLDSTVISDFTNTMTEGTAVEQLARTSTTSAKDLEYFAVCIGGDVERLLPLKASTVDECKVVKGYKASISPSAISSFSFLSEVDAEASEAPAAAAAGGAGTDAAIEMPNFKVTIALNKKAPLTDILHAVVTSCIDIGRTVELPLLRLLDFIDSDGGHHRNISYHPFPILSAKSVSKLSVLIEKAKTEGLPTVVANSSDGIPFLTCMFGHTEKVEECANRKDFSLLNIEIDDAGYEPLPALGTDLGAATSAE